MKWFIVYFITGSCYEFDLISCYMFEADIEWQFATTRF